MLDNSLSNTSNSVLQKSAFFDLLLKIVSGDRHFFFLLNKFVIYFFKSCDIKVYCICVMYQL